MSPYSHHMDLKNMLEQLHINETVTLIALSMGGRVAINFSLAYPEKTHALILADVAVDGFAFHDFKLDHIYETGKTKTIEIANRLWLDHELFESARRNITVTERLREMVMFYSGWHWVNKNPMQALTPPAIQQLDRIRTPALIITGEMDIAEFQEIAIILHKAIRQSVKKVIRGVGHMCNMEDPNSFNTVVSDFLNSLKK